MRFCGTRPLSLVQESSSGRIAGVIVRKNLFPGNGCSETLAERPRGVPASPFSQSVRASALPRLGPLAEPCARFALAGFVSPSILSSPASSPPPQEISALGYTRTQPPNLPHRNVQLDRILSSAVFSRKGCSIPPLVTLTNYTVG